VTVSDSFIDTLAGIVGAEHVLTDTDLTAGYTVDWTGRWQGETTAVVRPANTAEVAAVVKACANAGVSVVPQGGNTGLVGASVPANGEVLLSTRRLDAIESVDPIERTMAAGAGVILAEAQRAAASVDLMLGIDLAARDSATLGGVVATNAGGLRVIKHGTTRSQLAGIEVVLADGTVLRRWSNLVKDNTGYDLTRLFAGSEGTLGIITGVLLRLSQPPRNVRVVIAGVDSLDTAHTIVGRVQRDGLTLEAAEFFNAEGLHLLRDQSGLRQLFAADYATYVLLEVSECSDERLAGTLEALGDLVGDATIEAGPAPRLWAYREGFTEAIRTAATTLGTPAIKLDVAVPLRSHAAFESDLRAMCLKRHPSSVVVSFGHLAEGNSHVNLLGVPTEDRDAVTEAALRLVVEHGGTISAEHGIGRLKREWLRLQRPDADIAAMQAIKSALDPSGLFSPGTLFPGR
jgi:FAD/FMN-containing dehydrogenase